MLQKILKSKTKNFTLAACILASSTLLSGLLGLLRDRLLAGTFGAGETLDIYFVAFRIPDFVQAVLVAGGIGATFLPIFSEEFRKSKEKAIAFANNLLNCSFLFLIIVCLLLSIFTPFLLKIVAPGFNADQIGKAVSLTRIMFLSPILFGLSLIFSGILQYFDRFLAYGFAPILYNVGIIFGIIFLVPIFGIYGLPLGVVLGALAHLLIQIPSARESGYCYQRILNLKNYRLKRVLYLMAPSAIGFAFVQLNLMAMTALSSVLSSGSIAIFNFARNIQGIPVGLLGAPFAIAIFPVLSRNWAAQEKEKFWHNFSFVLRQIIFLVMPLSFFIFMLRAQIIRIVLGTGLWGWRETRLTAACLGVFSMSIIFSSLIIFLRKAFYAIQETKVPTLIEGITFFLNISLCLLFLFILRPSTILSETVERFLRLEGIEDIRVVAFPLAVGLSTLSQSILLFYLFIRKTAQPGLAKIFSYLGNIIFLTLLSGGAIWLSLRALVVVFSSETFWGIFFQTGIAFLAGLLVYLGGALVLNLPELESLKRPLLKETSGFEH